MADDARVLVAKALPTKEFFVEMLVRDITLSDAITDLVDNSVDGARRLRPNASLTDLWVRIVLSAESFRIVDNCGGIPLELAQEYAFRFGRDPRMPATPRSIGQFGVGMKRALFKMGRAFEIDSRTAEVSYRIKFNLDQWKISDVWDFVIDDVAAGREIPDERGVTIVVSSLLPSVSADFGSPVFAAALGAAIREKHQTAIQAGLAISVGGVPLTANLQQLWSSEDLKPANELLPLDIDGDAVDVRIYAGVGPSDPSRAGWYVYCNGRLIVGPDQTRLTGWGADLEATIPRYHNQFARFRGFVFFDSDSAAALPWTTTKATLDVDSAAYRATLPRMLLLMRPVIDFLNSLDAEKSLSQDEADARALGSLEAAITAARPTALFDLPSSATFVAPKPQPRPPTFGSIQYQRPLAQIRQLQRALGATTNREVGERTFDHYLEFELGEN